MFIGCQLAHHTSELPTQYPLVAEPKLDGFRLVAHIDGDRKVTFYSRGGKSEPFTANLAHVAEALSASGAKDCYVDGEISAGTWNDTAKLVRLKSPSAAQLAVIRARVVFHAFDIVPLDSIESAPVGRVVRMVCRESHTQRSARLGFILDSRFACIIVVPGVVVNSPAEVELVHGKNLAAGHEGTMLKRMDAPYVFDRTENWIALKPTRTVDARILGSIEGAGKHVGRLGALEVEAADGTRFRVGTGFNDKERAALWAERASLVGLWVEARMQDCSVATARHPSFVRMRPDRD